MPSIATLPSLGPFGRVVDVRVYPHGLVGGGDINGVGSGIARPNLSHDDWYSPGNKYGGNVLWPGSSPRYTISYAGPRYRLFGVIVLTDSNGTYRCWRTSFALNGANVGGPGAYILGAGIRTYDDLPTTVGTYSGAGDGTLSLATPATGDGAVTGRWFVRCIEGGPAARFALIDPDGVPCGSTGMDALFDGPVRFTVTAGGIAFASGDQWPVDVEQREQIVLICHSSTSSPTPDLIYRRSRDAATPWRLVGSVAPIAGAQYPAPSPWTINASGTHAATVRIVSGTFTRCILDLAALTIAQTAISQPTIQVVRSGDSHTTPNTGPHETIIGAEYKGDVLREWIVVAQGEKAGGASGGSAVAGTIAMTAHLEVRDGGGAIATAPIWSYSATVGATSTAGTWNSSGTHMEFTRHVYAWGHGDVPVGQWPVTVWSGTVDVADGSTTHTGIGIFSIVCESLSKPGNTVAVDYTLTTPDGGGAAAAFSQSYFADVWATDVPDCRTPSTTDSPWKPFAFGKGAAFAIGLEDQVQELFGLHGLNWARLGGAGNVSGTAASLYWASGGWSIFGNDIHFGGQNGERLPDWFAHAGDNNYGGGGPVSSLSFPGRPSVGAADARGNYMVAIEEASYAVLTPSHLVFNRANGTGNMLLFTGGPDLLTNAKVHTIVGSTDNREVAVGTF